ncbi:MAG: protein-glutamate O-methyltransferase CheR [Cellulosilyticaceae bacterium]
MIDITVHEFERLADLIRTNYGINLKEEKKSLVIKRLHSVLETEGFSSFTQYYNALIKDKTGNMLEVLTNKITTNHTYFMREEDHFYYFRDIILPQLKNTINNRDIRIWSAACSTGEEPYTLAMIIDEFFGKEKSLWDTKILATDLSMKVLKLATEGIYSSESVSALPKQWVVHYMDKIDTENYSIKDTLKKQVIYRRFNLMQETYYFKKPFDVIFLRNVLIYFEHTTQEQLIEKMYQLLKPGGYLFIGHSEFVNKNKSKFEYVQPAIYRK